jgi:hypothetical protein
MDRFTPTVSGKYFLEAFQYSTYGGTALPVNEYVRIRKNGANIAESSAFERESTWIWKFFSCNYCL